MDLEWTQPAHTKQPGWERPVLYPCISGLPNSARPTSRQTRMSSTIVVPCSSLRRRDRLRAHYFFSFARYYSRMPVNSEYSVSRGKRGRIATPAVQPWPSWLPP